ncbi:Polygalacturonase [Cohaesibacter marisflavi]|uniref:Polygalacturonase n=1 Tax=Cohaesibacter marisflavi TaxID=655353 RepID=A0A1I4ZRV7_9HYPH|nr:glycoside hydrolase family 28 protein [Cohaesibacter marisflavi]SFN52719.1 Polygalacturonase [Cohaesibacter marisflavi]
MMTITASAITARTVALCLNPDGKARFFLPQKSHWTLYKTGEIVRSGETDRVITFIDCLDPATQYVFEVDTGESFTFTTAECAGRVDIRDFGARTEAANNGAAIAAALASVPVGGALAIPEGRWQTGPLFLKSDMTLHLEPGATLVFITDRDQIPILPAHTAQGDMLGSWEGLPDACYASIVTAIGCTNLEITGSGTLDGAGAEGDWWSWPKERRNGARRARTLFLNNCEAVTVSGITVQNSPSWTVHPLYCHDIEFVALAIKNPADSPNTDGLDPECCSDVLLEGIHFTVGDDCIAIKACKRGDDGSDDHIRPCEHITVRHCYMERGHGAVVIGSEMSGSVRHVTVEHCEFLGTDRGLRLKTRRGRGGEIAHVRCRNIIMQEVHSAIVANCFYFCDHDGRSEWVQSRAPYPVDASTPSIHDIEISDLVIRDVRVVIGAFYGLPEMPIRSVSINNIHASFDNSTEGDVPVMALQVPTCHHVGFSTEFAELNFQNEHEYFPLSIEKE